MTKNQVILIFNIILLVNGVLSTFMTIEDGKEYKFEVKMENKAFLEGSPLHNQFLHADMYVRKSSDDTFSVMLKNVDVDGLGDKNDLEKPFKVAVKNYKVDNFMTSGRQFGKDFETKNRIIDEFVKDYSNFTRYFNSSISQELLTLELALGICKTPLRIKLVKDEIKMIAEGKKENCIIPDDVYGPDFPKSVDPKKVTTEDSMSGLEVKFDRLTKQFKQLEQYADIHVHIKNMILNTKIKLSFEYKGSEDAIKNDDSTYFSDHAQKFMSFYKSNF